ncbi:hypothetical protein GCM10017557_49920 [Streptomyces aurantiacus]|uniref:Uncharacterized protein n=1 Tax=Streptomyces aurantiacus TaxID=47760 RepID=A0A7G1P2Z8_9ACTN|nr:hypothetical protein GCM10017557_49920 [Streptomyces aurantiacus]
MRKPITASAVAVSPATIPELVRTTLSAHLSYDYDYRLPATGYRLRLRLRLDATQQQVRHLFFIVRYDASRKSPPD